VQFHGHVSVEAVADVMQNSDVLLVPSLWFENFPGVIVQALEQGLPVLASDRGGIAELVEDGVNGYLLPPGDISRWSTVLADVIAQPTQLDRLRAGATRTRGDFALDFLGRRVADIMRSTIEEARE
jgi:glycosyltransferase involved in cell wall biosynthesis